MRRQAPFSGASIAPNGGDAMKPPVIINMSFADYLALLPLRLSLRRRMVILIPLAFVFSAVVAAAICLIVAAEAPNFRHILAHSKGAYLLLIWPGALIWIFLYLAFSAFVFGIARFRDALQRGPLLIIEAEGLRDLRYTTALIPWADVDTYDLIGGSGRAARDIVLDLRKPPSSSIRWVRLILRAIAVLRLPHRNRLRLDLFEVSAMPADICRLLIAMIEHHGGKRRIRWYEPQVP